MPQRKTNKHSWFIFSIIELWKDVLHIYTLYLCFICLTIARYIIIRAYYRSTGWCSDAAFHAVSWQAGEKEARTGLCVDNPSKKVSLFDKLRPSSTISRYPHADYNFSNGDKEIVPRFFLLPIVQNSRSMR